MKTIQSKNNFVYWLLSVSVAAITLISLVFPGGPVQAAPTGTPYIIVFKDTVNPAAEAPGVANAHGLQLGFIYQHALKGMSALVPEGRLEGLKHVPRVEYVEKDMEQSINVQSMPTGIQRDPARDDRRCQRA